MKPTTLHGHGPSSVADVLRAEYAALRPEVEIPAGASESDLFTAVHAATRPLGALCLSGGGIRSAMFSLGVLQGVAERGLLEQFDYLSTVSGGGYIGSWLVAWAHRAGGLRQILPFLERNATATPGPVDPIRHLREYSSYMSPQRGLMSFDVWTLVATVLQDLLLNWLVLVPLLMAVLIVPRLYLSLLATPERWYHGAVYLRSAVDYRAPELDAIGKSFSVSYLLPVASTISFAVALFNTLRYLPGVGRRRHSHFDYLTKVLAPLMLGVLLFLGFDSLYYVGSNYVEYSHVWGLVAWAAAAATIALTASVFLTHRTWTARRRLLTGLAAAVYYQVACTAATFWFTTNVLLWNPDPAKAPSWATYVTVGPAAILLGYGLATALFVGFSSRVLSDADREWLSRSIGGVLMLAVAWAAGCAIVLLVPTWLVALSRWSQTTLTAVAAVSGAAGAFIGWRSSRSARGSDATRSSTSTTALAMSAAAVFSVLLLAGLSLLTNRLLIALAGSPVPWYEHSVLLNRTGLLPLALTGAGLALLGALLARWIDTNTFSLHGMYRDRLVRAFLGASNARRHVNTFTGFASTDDLPMHDLDARQTPLPVVNATLNLVSADRLDWQERKAAPFTVTPIACGSSALGYRPSAHYGGRRGISLGTAAAISGAAASPNMGYHSSAALSFVMTVFNARLGVWMGNPGAPGNRTWRRSSPKSAITSILAEAFGRTSDRSDYVYLSDGGHFENLGVYEMVRRRCRFIVAIDAASDPEFELGDLGNALRKVRIDLKIPIVFGDVAPIRAHRQRCAVARIQYSAVDGRADDGWLVYVKAMCTGTEPPDVESYRAAHPTFPHQSTADQWFDESQTESYRALGLHTIDELCQGWAGGSLESFCRHVDAAQLGGAATPEDLAAPMGDVTRGGPGPLPVPSAGDGS